MTTEKSKYAQDGVDVEVGDDFSSIAGKVCRATYNNSSFVEVLDLSKGHFRGKRAYRFVNLPSGYLIDQSSDGNGTKTALTVASGRYLESAKDLNAMVSGDMVAAGSMPLVLNNILDVATLGEKDSHTFNACKDLIMGLKFVADKEGLVLFKGETAELGAFVGSEDPNAILKFNWGATVTGVTHPDKIITGDTLAPGQFVVALREFGFRANGISSVRKAFKMEYGEGFWNDKRAFDDICAAAEPSVSYNKMILELHGWTRENFEPLVKIHAIAHITGGGIKSKLGDDLLFQRGLSADLNDLWDLPPIMYKCATWRGLSSEELYSTWNCGNGMLVVIDKEDWPILHSISKDHNIQAKIAGEITQEDGTAALHIKSKLTNSYISYAKE